MLHKNGNERFDRCPYKKPDVNEDGGELDCPKIERTGIVVRIQPGAFADASNVTKNNEGKWMYHSVPHALIELREAAGALVCTTCTYYKLGPEKLANRLADEARANARLLEARAIEARAQAEYDAIMAKIENPEPPSPGTN